MRDLARLALGVSYTRPAAAARWLASTFGFTSPDPLPEGNDPLPETGHGHPWIEFRLGNSSLMIFKLGAEGTGRPTIVTELASPWGLPFYVVDDLEGNRWTFAQARPTRIGMDLGFGVTFVRHSPPNSPASPNPPRKTGSSPSCAARRD